jgi:hypothetical protein
MHMFLTTGNKLLGIIGLVIEKFPIIFVSAVKFPPATQSGIFTTADTRDHQQNYLEFLNHEGNSI